MYFTQNNNIIRRWDADNTLFLTYLTKLYKLALVYPLSDTLDGAHPPSNPTAFGCRRRHFDISRMYDRYIQILLWSDCNNSCYCVWCVFVRFWREAAEESSMSVHFEERSGVIPCKTAWGSWSQTMEEVFIEVDVPPGTPAKEIKCTIGSKQIELRVKDQQIFKVWVFTECLRSRQGCCCCWELD